MPVLRGDRGWSLSRREIPALNNALLQERVFGRATLQGQACGKDTQGDPRPGEQEGRPREGQSRHHRATRDEAEGGGKEGRGRH